MQGGMKAVIWTDVFQFLVILAGLLAIIIQVSFYKFLMHTHTPHHTHTHTHTQIYAWPTH